jgi:hypothetical protein
MLARSRKMMLRVEASDIALLDAMPISRGGPAFDFKVVGTPLNVVYRPIGGPHPKRRLERGVAQEILGIRRTTKEQAQANQRPLGCELVTGYWQKCFFHTYQPFLVRWPNVNCFGNMFILKRKLTLFLIYTQ